MFDEMDDKLESFHKDKKLLADRQLSLTKENEELKLKFSRLLDQF